MRYAFILPLALLAASPFATLGESAAIAITGQSSADGRIGTTSQSSPPLSLPSSATEEASNGGLPAIGSSSQAGAVSIIEEISKLAKQLPDEVMIGKLIPGIDPNTPWRELPMVAMDVEGNKGSPTQFGLVAIDGAWIGDETTLHITPRSGDMTKVAVSARRLLSQAEPELPSKFESKLDEFTRLTAGRVPLAYQSANERAAIAAEIAVLSDLAPDLHLADPGVAWIDAGLWVDVFPEYKTPTPALGNVHFALELGQLDGAHIAVNDARAAAKVLFRLSERKEFRRFGPTTYEELIRFQEVIKRNGKLISELRPLRVAEIELPFLVNQGR